MFGKVDLGLLGEDDSVRAFLESGFELVAERQIRLGGMSRLNLTSGIISAGSVTSLCANSSL